MDGYFRNNLLEPKSLKVRHDELIVEMLRRGYKHNTPLEFEDTIFEYLGSNKSNKINKSLSLNTLINKCQLCKERLNKMVEIGMITKEQVEEMLK